GVVHGAAAHRGRSASGHHGSLYAKIYTMCYHRDPPRNPVLQGGEERRWPLRGHSGAIRGRGSPGLQAGEDVHRSGLYSVSTEETVMVKHVKVIVEKHPDGYVAYPLGLRGVIVGEGDTY